MWAKILKSQNVKMDELKLPSPNIKKGKVECLTVAICQGFCWLMPQSGRPSTTARLTLPVPECCSHSVSPRYTLAFLSLTAGWRSLVALSSPPACLPSSPSSPSSFSFPPSSPQLRSHTWWSKDGVYHRGRTQQVIKVHMWQSVAGS